MARFSSKKCLQQRSFLSSSVYPGNCSPAEWTREQRKTIGSLVPASPSPVSPAQVSPASHHRKARACSAFAPRILGPGCLRLNMLLRSDYSSLQPPWILVLDSPILWLPIASPNMHNTRQIQGRLAPQGFGSQPCNCRFTITELYPTWLEKGKESAKLAH